MRHSGKTEYSYGILGELNLDKANIKIADGVESRSHQ